MVKPRVNSGSTGNNVYFIFFPFTIFFFQDLFFLLLLLLFYYNEDDVRYQHTGDAIVMMFYLLPYPY
jgi:hypothetical protein